MSTEKKARRPRAKTVKKVVWVPAAQVETKQAAEALGEIRRVRFPAPTGKVGRPRHRANILGII